MKHWLAHTANYALRTAGLRLDYLERDFDDRPLDTFSRRKLFSAMGSEFQNWVTHQRVFEVIDVFNAAHDIAAILETHGYARRGKRFAAPDTSHGAGVVLLDDGRVFCHHQGDPLNSEHALDTFDVYRLLDHGGDYRAAVKAAAEALGIKRERAA